MEYVTREATTLDKVISGVLCTGVSFAAGLGVGSTFPEYAFRTNVTPVAVLVGAQLAKEDSGEGFLLDLTAAHVGYFAGAYVSQVMEFFK